MMKLFLIILWFVVGFGSVIGDETGNSTQPSSSACSNGPEDRQCWGEFDINTNYYDVTPDTGNTVEYFLTVDNVTMAPDGVERLMLVYNNSYPGPLITANWGDWVVVHVTNNLQNNGFFTLWGIVNLSTSIHWHGIIQENNCANDGVPGVTQCPIPPGSSFTYKFRATRYGTTWYHSHFSLQYSEGLLGPFVINGPSSANWDVDLGPVIVQDWFHTPVFQVWFAERTIPPIFSDTGLINGKNMNGSLGEYTEFTFVSGTRYLLRIINTSTDQHFKFSIDGHTMTVITSDFTAIEPYNQTVLDIGIGQRYNVIVAADQPPANYWMRAVTATGCSANFNGNGIQAIVRYSGTNQTSDPTSTPYDISTMVCQDETGLVPIVPVNLGFLSYGEELPLDLVTENYVKFLLNGTSLFIDWDNPTLLQAENLDPTFPDDDNVISLNGTSDTWTYFLLQSVGTLGLNHPIHLHGHDFLLLASGEGIYNDSVLTQINPNNPTRRDVVTMPTSPTNVTGGFILIAFQLTNPGTWLLHCHIAFHISMGLGVQFVERIDEISGNVGVTSDWTTLCEAWESYQSAQHPEQDDSGL